MINRHVGTEILSSIIRCIWPLVILAGFSNSGQRCWAQWLAFDREQLAAEVESAVGQLDATQLPDPQIAKSRFLESVDQAKLFIGQRTSAQNFANWFDYLDVEPLTEVLAQKDALTDRSAARTVGREAVALRYRLVGTHAGLELSVLQNLRQSTQQLIDAVRFRDRERSIKQLEKQLESVADKIREMEEAPDSEDLALISQTIQLLQAAHQSPALVAQLRSRFASPNLRIVVSEGAVQSAVNRDVNDLQPVRDCILGTAIVGKARVCGAVSADVLPGIGSARLRLSLSSSVNSTNLGYKKPIRLRTTGYGQVDVSRTLYVDESGVRAEPVVSQASLRVDINSVEHRLRIVRKIASRKVAEQKPQADRIARERMRKRVAKQFEEQTDEATQVQPPDVMQRLRPLLGRLDLKEPSRSIGSTDTSIYAEATLARGDQLASPSFGLTAPPVTGAFDAAIQVHEVVIDNAVAPVLAGRTLTESQLDTLLRRTPDQDGDGDEDKEPFEIDFARLRPIVFEARDQSVRVGVRGTRFAKGANVLKRTMEITTLYRPARMPGGSVVLIRDGEIDVSFPSKRKRRLSVTQTGLKKTIQKKFATVFPELLLDQPLTVPPTIKAPSIAGRDFRIANIDAQNGWLTIAVQR